jgi:hypothetical protein
MTMSVCKSVAEKYCPRFGALAVEMGFINETQLQEGLNCQIDEESRGRSRRLLGTILFDKGWMSSQQVDRVMTELLYRMRKEAA